MKARAAATRPPGLHATIDTPQHLPLFRTTVDEIADIDHPSREIPEDAFNIRISEPMQQPMQRVGVSVNVANKIVSVFDQTLPFPNMLKAFAARSVFRGPF